MDFRRPIEAVIPGARGRLLGVLTRTTRELSLRTLADLAGVSPSQASRVLGELVHLGLVHRRDVPPAALFILVRENVAAQAIELLAGLRESIMSELRRQARHLRPQPFNLTVFGSFARREAGPDSDIDLLVVRPAEVSDEDPAWSEMVLDLDGRVRAITGNPVNIVESDETEVARRLRAPAGMWRAVVEEGETLAGTPLARLERASGG